MNARIRLTLIALALAAGCSPPAERTDGGEAPATASAVALADTVLSLERTPCFGFCPVYLLTFDSTGHGVLRGQAPNASFSRDVEVPAEALRMLLDRMEQEGFFSLDTAFTPGHPLCSAAATDHSGAIITVIRGGRRHQIRHYHGCYTEVRPDGQPVRAPALTQLIGFEDAIDSLAGVGQWLDSLRGR